MKFKGFLTLMLLSRTLIVSAQNEAVKFQQQKNTSKTDIIIGGKYFSSFFSIEEKPVLFPILTADGITITRGYPIAAREGERTDHPHHIGLWFNYESVNGLDFWNNSSAIPAAKKSGYGWVREVKVTKLKEGAAQGELVYQANWEKQDRTVLLKETTSLVFSGDKNNRIINRTTTLTAQKDTVFFKDVKDGMLGLRVTKELELPSDKPEEFKDIHGNITKVTAAEHGATGNYLTSMGKAGNDAWGTRGNWCLLYGTKNNEPVSVAMIDHSENPGYPTYWHARNYGLFAANPLGQKVFSNGSQELNMKLKPGQSVTFRYQIIVRSNASFSADELNKEANKFSSKM